MKEAFDVKVVEEPLDIKEYGRSASPSVDSAFCLMDEAHDRVYCRMVVA